jgi:hypothetical protein
MKILKLVLQKEYVSMLGGFNWFTIHPMTHFCEDITFVSEKEGKFLNQSTIQLQSYIMELILQHKPRYLKTAQIIYDPLHGMDSM